MKEDPSAKNFSPNVYIEPDVTRGMRQSKPQLKKKTIPRPTPGRITALSFAQQGMWFLKQLDPTSPVCNSYRTWRVRGAPNVEALRKAFEAIAACHEVLRAVIQIVDRKACQIINEEWTLPFPCLDLRECSFEAPEIAANNPPRGEGIIRSITEAFIPYNIVAAGRVDHEFPGLVSVP